MVRYRLTSYSQLLRVLYTHYVFSLNATSFFNPLLLLFNQNAGTLNNLEGFLVVLQIGVRFFLQDHARARAASESVSNHKLGGFLNSVQAKTKKIIKHIVGQMGPS